MTADVTKSLEALLEKDYNSWCMQGDACFKLLHVH